MDAKAVMVPERGMLRKRRMGVVAHPAVLQVLAPIPVCQPENAIRFAWNVTAMGTARFGREAHMSAVMFPAWIVIIHILKTRQV